MLVLSLLRELHVGNPAVFWTWIARPDPFALFVFAVAFWRLSRSGSPTAGARDPGLVLGIGAAAIVLAAERSQAGLGLCLAALGMLSLAHGRADPELRAAGICMLALCANMTITPLIFRLGYDHIVALDMALLQAAIDWSGAPVTATPAGLVADDGTRVLLVGACSSFGGISAAILVHMGWAMALRTHVSWRDAVAVAATVAVATALNIVRLTLTASGQESYAFWHGDLGEAPLGGQFFWFAHVAILLSGGYLSAFWASGGSGGRERPA